jgi:hypothetical protein
LRTVRGGQRSSGPRRGHRWLALALADAAIVLTACGDDDTSPAKSSADAAPTSSEAAKAPEQLVLKTNTKFLQVGGAAGTVVSGSRLGDSELCIGTKFRDRQSGGAWLVNRTLRCPGGQITLGFTPEEAVGNGTQSGKWGIVGATGRYTGLKGSGELNLVYTGGPDRKARETFTGTVTR